MKNYWRLSYLSVNNQRHPVKSESMILIFGGTTEGRYAVKVCEEAGKPYYYSTKSASQEIQLVNGIRLTGGMELPDMVRFCREKEIRLVIDAAHPFATELHRNVAELSGQLHLPLVRYERIYPEDPDDILYFQTYEEIISYLKENRIRHPLFLSGAHTIRKFKPYWEEQPCIFRILDRDESREIARQEGLPPERIIYYNGEEDETALFKGIQPSVIITKESGKSGGFMQKVNAAKHLQIPVLVIRRPTFPLPCPTVQGEYGLRKEIERSVPDFFPLRTGYTTGSCATAAIKAALIHLLSGKNPIEVTITLPAGESIRIPVYTSYVEKETGFATVIKDAGDDPDITNGLPICSAVRFLPDQKGVYIHGGEGIGTVTLPGLGLEIGAPAINRVPQEMIRKEVTATWEHFHEYVPGQPEMPGIEITLSVPGGETIAQRTFNPKLGITGGISIIGTSGIVRPFSSEAFIQSIRREMEVSKAIGCHHIVINSGAKSERMIRQQFPDLPPQAFIHYGNFIGKTLEIASTLHFRKVTLGIMIGKAVKLAAGALDTHSKKVVMDKDFLAELARQASCPDTVIQEIRDITLARQLWEILPDEKHPFYSLLIQKCGEHCSSLLSNSQLEIRLINETND